MRQIWTDADFERMSWHDNHVHAIRCVEGENGEGELVLDIDHILEWLKGNEGGLRFRVQPATLVFHSVMFLRIAIDYAAATAAFGPFMIDGIERRIEKREHYEAQVWRLPISWPGGQIEFEARGFTQTAEGLPLVTSSQQLTPAERRHAP
ncbi:hypothetical protein [Steroidobacter cummioxidans]|uniref:hypothetical protein n=1 Tax=Steroidobacter cummioxidans TaxID=1803913 RepID=UPI000E31AC90|nr:hypothetical protein [Steroidobacter cummioxidans]